MIPISLKKFIKESLFYDVKELMKKHSDIKNRLNIKPGSYIISFSLKKHIKDYETFVNKNKNLLIKKYENLLASSGLQIIPAKDGNITTSIMDYFLNNFYEYLVYFLTESKEIEKDFEIEWNKFEKELFSAINKLEVIVHVKNLYFHGGEIIEEFIPWINTKLIWTKSSFEYRLLGWERNGGHNFEFIKTFEPPWILLKRYIDINKQNQLRPEIEKAKEKFNLVLFIIRNEIRGNPFFNNIRLFGLGHYSPSGFITTSLISELDNDIHEEYGKPATLDNPHDYFFKKLLSKVDENCYKKFEFIDWQLRMIGKIEINEEMKNSKKRLKYYLFQKLLNLLSTLNSLLPDIEEDNKKNKDNRENYIPVLLEKIFKMDKNKIIKTINNVYNLRNKIVHGDIEKIDEIMTEIYCDITLLIEDLRFTEYIISQIIKLTLVNLDFKKIEEEYYKTKKPEILPKLILPYT